jgi:hypothetical protein
MFLSLLFFLCVHDDSLPLAVIQADATIAKKAQTFLWPCCKIMNEKIRDSPIWVRANANVAAALKTFGNN